MIILREMKVFKMMASFIGTRDGIQCRSHHMKQMRAHRNKIRNIVNTYKKKNDLEEYFVQYQQLTNGSGEILKKHTIELPP